MPDPAEELARLKKELAEANARAEKAEVAAEEAELARLEAELAAAKVKKDLLDICFEEEWGLLRNKEGSPSDSASQLLEQHRDLYLDVSLVPGLGMA